MSDPRSADIAKRAYMIWESEGRPDGKDLDHWLRAEAELRAPLAPAARVAKSPPPKSAVRGRNKSPAAS